MSNARRAWVLTCGERYWGRRVDLVTALPMPCLGMADATPGRLVRVDMPAWASDIAVDGQLLAFSACLTDGSGPEWSRYDWLAVAWHMLVATHEREHEERFGPILSYAFRLPAEIHPLFERAWANRIFMFLRRWVSQSLGQPETQILGPMPKASLILTHDVDALTLTPEIRLKQGAFQLANAMRAVAGGRISVATGKLAVAGRFVLGRGNFQTLARIRDMERACGLRSILHFYGGQTGLRRCSPRRILIDPAYDVAGPYLRAELRALADGGWTIGLHQSFNAWKTGTAMHAERRRVEMASGMRVVHCRQHWLHFSWGKTWQAQQQAGLASDSTLGFNDRPGFRAGHALRVCPWDFVSDAPMQLEALPMLFMDAHFYDYKQIGPSTVGAAMRRWIDEVRAVGGEATVNWHSHTITEVYGWGSGFEELLAELSAQT